MRLTICFLCVNLVGIVHGESIQQGQQFPFPPQYLLNQFISTDRTIYLPPEYQTAASLSPTNIKNNLPNKLPPAFDGYPTSTVNYADINNLRRGEIILKHNTLSGNPSSNQTSRQTNQQSDKRIVMAIPQAINYKQNIDRMDTKIAQLPAPKETTKDTVVNPNQMLREVVISADNNKNQDLSQKASYHSIAYATPPHIIIHSTTEPAIPILRLTNEMDLDGSFSYEALIGDQTHYVQQGRMENIGTDKEGPVVEGSYSYVGDDGQTYTVHYIADSNGYRATGDHLPVPPPIPEIIQRSIQYNLAEEAKRPPNYQYFEEVENDSSPSNNDKVNLNYFTTPHSLFTGRTPEAFSIAFPFGTNTQNNLTPMASTKESIKTNVKFSEDKSKRKNNYGPLEPQITFLASQGAHVPSPSTGQKSSMTQLVNIESGINELEQDNNKGLWRWQYGVNNKTVAENPIKDTISRSSGEGEDIVINFGDMTPEEYTKVIRKQIYKDIHTNLNNNDYQQAIEKNYNENYFVDDLKESNTSYRPENQINQAIDKNYKTSVFTSENSVIYTSSENPYDNYAENYKDYGIQADDIVNQNKFVKEINYYPGVSSTENTLWMDQKDQVKDSKRTIITDKDTIHQNKYSNYEYNSNHPQNLYWPAYNTFSEKKNIVSSTPVPVDYYFIQPKDNTDPLINREVKEENLVQNIQDFTTTETDIKDAVRHNIFLKNLLLPKVHKPLIEEVKKISPQGNNFKTVSNSFPKPYNVTKPFNQMKTIEKRPLDVTDILNYIVNKNMFESSRLKTKNQSPTFKSLTQLKNLNQKPEGKIDDRIDEIKNKENKEDVRVGFNNYRQNHPQELRGNIKNYKVLLRNNPRDSSTDTEAQTQPLPGLQNKSTHVKYPPLGRAGPSMKSYLPPIYL